MKQKYLDLAKQKANSFEKPEDICPRDIINPGFYFGFLAGVRLLLNEFEEFTKRCNEIADADGKDYFDLKQENYLLQQKVNELQDKIDNLEGWRW